MNRVLWLVAVAATLIDCLFRSVQRANEVNRKTHDASKGKRMQQTVWAKQRLTQKKRLLSNRHYEDHDIIEHSLWMGKAMRYWVIESYFSNFHGLWEQALKDPNEKDNAQVKANLPSMTQTYHVLGFRHRFFSLDNMAQCASRCICKPVVANEGLTGYCYWRVVWGQTGLWGMKREENILLNALKLEPFEAVLVCIEMCLIV